MAERIKTAGRVAGAGGALGATALTTGVLESLIFSTTKFTASDWMRVAALIIGFSIVAFGLIAITVGLYLSTSRSPVPPIKSEQLEPYALALLTGLVLVIVGAITVTIVVLASSSA